MVNRERSRKNKNNIRFSVWNIIIVFFAIAAFFVLGSCNKGGSPQTGSCKKTKFDAASFYGSNTVEIAAAGNFGVVNTGTGVIISGDEFPIIVSNFHVAGKYGEFITVRFPGETEFVNTDTLVNKNIIRVLAYDESLDLCIFMVDYKPTTIYNNMVESESKTGTVPFTEFSQASVGTKVISLGNSGGGGISKLEGEIISLERIVNTKYGYLPVIQTTLAIEDGCSGGPMFDKKGKFLGITSFGGGSWGEQYSFSIPAAFVYKLYREALDIRPGGQIEKLNGILLIKGDEQQPLETSVYFEDLDIRLKLIDGKMIFSESTSYSKFFGYTVVEFGKTKEVSLYTFVLAEAMRYSTSCNGYILKLIVEKNGICDVLEFPNYKLKN